MIKQKAFGKFWCIFFKSPRPAQLGSRIPGPERVRITAIHQFDLTFDTSDMAGQPDPIIIFEAMALAFIFVHIETVGIGDLPKPCIL